MLRNTLSNCARRAGLFRATSSVLVAAGAGAGPGTRPTSGLGLFEAFRQKYQEYELKKDKELDEMEEEFVKERKSALFGEDEMPSSTSSLKHVSEDPKQCPRSVLFVPGIKPRAMEKIYSLPADCFIIDLEDSVGPSHKRQAREHILKFVTEFQQKRKEGLTKHRRLIVRINSPDFDYSNAILDLNMVGELGKHIEGIAIPKVTTATYGMVKDYIHPEHVLCAFFESPISVLQAPQICGQGVYKYAVMGYNDLAAELQLPLSVPAEESSNHNHDSLYANMSSADAIGLHTVRRMPLWNCACQVLLSARANKMFCLDGVFNNPNDTEGFKRDLRYGLSLGFDGKTLIHPSQIKPTNKGFTPDDAAVKWAEKVQEAVARAEGNVATVDGAMIEELHVKQARRTILLHKSAQQEIELEQRQNDSEGEKKN